MLHKESLRPPDKSSTFFLIVVIILLFFVVALSNFLYNRWAVPYTGYGVYVVFILVGIYIYRFRLLDFRYSMIDDELIFERMVGKREKLIARVKMKHVLSFRPIDSADSYKGDIYKTYKMLLYPATQQVYALYMKDTDKVVLILFCPSEELIDLIKRGISMRN